MKRRPVSTTAPAIPRAPRAWRHGRPLRITSLLVGLAAVACGAAPDAREKTATTDEALNPTQVIVPTTYVLKIEGVNKLYENDNKYGGGFVEWAELGVRVNEADPSIMGCTLGRAPNNNVTLTNCQDGTFYAGQPLSRTVTVASESDAVKVAIVLDNVENADQGAAGSSAARALATLGDSVAGAGAIAGIANPVAGGIVAVVGAVLSVAGDLLQGSPHNEISCAGGLIALPDPPWAYTFPPVGSLPLVHIPNKPQDTMYLNFTGAQLEQMTADGPAEITFPVSIVWPGAIANEDEYTCNSAHNIHLSITRDWTTGLAPSPKSGDSAGVRTTSELDWFQVGLSSSSLVRRAGSASGWGSSNITADQAYNLSFVSSSVASISRAPSLLDAFFVDGNGRFVWASESIGKIFIVPTITPIVGGLPPNAHLSVASRQPNMFDVFMVDGTGAVATSHWPMTFISATYMSNPAALSGAGIAPPGAGIASVARTENNVDAFFIGNNGALWQSSWSLASGWTTAQISDAGLAPPGARVAAAARTTNNLDVFFVGNNGALYTSYWFAGAPSFATFQLGAPNVSRAGSTVSVVSRQPGSLDVAYVANIGGYWQVKMIEWQAGGGWAAPVAVSAATGMDATPSGDLSIVASGSWNMDILFRGVFGDSFDSTWHYSDGSWSTVQLP